MGEPMERLAKVPDGPDLDVLVAQIGRLREAGNLLALRAAYVGTHYDGIHRLLAAVARWYDVLATDFDRVGQGGHRHTVECWGNYNDPSTPLCRAGSEHSTRQEDGEA